MTRPEMLDQEIRELQEWLRAAWQQLADPSLTPLNSRELRSQMKQWNADLRALLARAAELQPKRTPAAPRTVAEPAMRIFAYR